MATTGKEASKVLGISLTKKQMADIEKRAVKMGITKSKYGQIVLTKWLDSGKALTLSEK